MLFSSPQSINFVYDWSSWDCSARPLSKHFKSCLNWQSGDGGEGGGLWVPKVYFGTIIPPLIRFWHRPLSHLSIVHLSYTPFPCNLYYIFICSISCISFTFLSLLIYASNKKYYILFVVQSWWPTKIWVETNHHGNWHRQVC